MLVLDSLKQRCLLRDGSEGPELTPQGNKFCLEMGIDVPALARLEDFTGADSIGRPGDGPAHVLGVSLGGLISQTLALRRPDLVRTAILMVGGGHFGPAWGPVMTGFVELYASGTVPPEPIQRFLMLQAMLTPEQRSDPAMVDLAVALAGGLTDSFGPGGQHGQYSASATWITEDHLSELTGLTVPVLVIANEHDPVFPPSGRHAMTALLPNSTYVEIPGVSHVAMDPASLTATMAAVVGFLAAH